MRIIKGSAIAQFIKKLGRRAGGHSADDGIESKVRKIINDVRKNGDSALRKYTEKFDSIKAGKIGVGRNEIKAAAAKAPKELTRALKESAKRIKAYHELQKEESWYFSEDGITLGHIIRPLERVGVYIPGGKAAYPSTVLMNVIPAKVAGVNEIALCVPTPEGMINPAVAAAITLLEITEVYAVGGAQAVAAMAYGTETIKKVDKIVGPGNVFVATAKKMVFGDVGIDMIAGPSEILIIADKSADPSFIAADLLGQAEHDEMASSILITDSASLAANVKKELSAQMKRLRRRGIAEKSVKSYGAVILVEDIAEGIDIANRIAPEHLELMTKNSGKILPKIKNAGAVFIGDWSPESLGDYSAGPNHTLPTCGTSRFSSPLGVYDFIKRTSMINANKEGFISLSKTVAEIADNEGLEGHANSVRVRLKKR
ncbi:MAG: histidinol dehydrogenase [Nitrospirae bacterium]|nr:histidinol dehydrogenase [Nitrospirota bacterium]